MGSCTQPGMGVVGNCGQQGVSGARQGPSTPVLPLALAFWAERAEMGAPRGTPVDRLSAAAHQDVCIPASPRLCLSPPLRLSLLTFFHPLVSRHPVLRREAPRSPRGVPALHSVAMWASAKLRSALGLRLCPAGLRDGEGHCNSPPGGEGALDKTRTPGRSQGAEVGSEVRESGPGSSLPRAQLRAWCVVDTGIVSVIYRNPPAPHPRGFKTEQISWGCLWLLHTPRLSCVVCLGLKETLIWVGGVLPLGHSLLLELRLAERAQRLLPGCPALVLAACPVPHRAKAGESPRGFLLSLMVVPYLAWGARKPSSRSWLCPASLGGLRLLLFGFSICKMSPLG